MAHLRPVPDPDGEQRRARLAAARLYLVCDCMPGDRDLSEFLAEAISGGVDVVQLREKHLEDEFLAEAASVAADACDAAGALFILNDRPDIAAMVRADGVHIGQQDMAVPRPARSSAQTCSSGSQRTPRARSTPPCCRHPTVGHTSTTSVSARCTRPRPSWAARPVGPELVRYASAHAHVPFFAIGGIDSREHRVVLDAGAGRVCVLRAICDARDPEQAALTLRGALELRPC